MVSNRMLEIADRNKLLYYLLILSVKKFPAPFYLSALYYSTRFIWTRLELRHCSLLLYSSVFHLLRVFFSVLKSVLESCRKQMYLFSKVSSLFRQKIYGLFNSYFCAYKNTLSSSSYSTVGIYLIYLLLFPLNRKASSQVFHSGKCFYFIREFFLLMLF